MKENVPNNLPSILGILAFGYFSWTSPQNTIFYHIGMGLLFYYLTAFIMALGGSLPIKELMALICLLQWIAAPVWVWNNYNDDPINYMPIDEAPYMSVVFPGTMTYLIGLNMTGVKLFTVRNTEAIAHLFQEKSQYFDIGKKLVYIGFFISVIFKFLPESLFYFGLLLSNLKLVGAMYIMLSNNKHKWYWVIITVAFNASGGLIDAVFHDLIIWMGYLFIIFFLVYKFSFRFKVTMFIVGIFLLFVLQSVKHEYRESEFEGATGGASRMYELFADRFNNPDKILNSDNYENIVARLNQGRIIGFILNHIPANQPFLEGYSISIALEALVPRFLYPNKRIIAGGFDKFALFTGRNLPFGTSMDISLIGEAYGNFGIIGGMVFLFIIGIVFSWSISKFLSFSNRFPSIVLWVPFVFFHIIKAESDFGSVVNQIFKSLIMLYLVIYVYKNQMILPKKKIPQITLT
ncbi:MAG: hypothetical protein K2Q22_05310 [Cytophagales bacterium]|nr:hypothetical protein [Cytophagales bacterium]